MPGCPTFTTLCNEEIYHEIEYIDAFYDLTEEEKEHLTQAQERVFIADPDKENEFEENVTVRKGGHLATCLNPGCVVIRNTWLETSSLKQYVVVI